MLGEGGLLRANLQGGLRSIERGESRPRDLLTKKRRAQVTKMDTWVGEGVTLSSKYCVAEILAQILCLFILYVLCM